MARKASPWFRASDRWWCIKIRGKVVRLAHGRSHKADAVRRWHELMAEATANPSPESGSHTVASVIDLHLTHTERAYSPACFADRRRYLQKFAEAHGFRRVVDCKPFFLTAWLDANPQWISDWTRSNVIRIVQRAFNWAVQQGIIPANPFRGVTHRPGVPRRPMTDEEFQALLRATARRRPNRWPRKNPPRRPTAGARFRQVLVFLRYTGARPCEMSRLKWTDVDLERGLIVMARHKTARQQRIPRPRVILLVPVVVKLLKCIRERQQPGEEYVFLTVRRSPWNRYSLGLRMKRLRKRAGLPLDAKLYGIRHQFGTQSIVNGCDIRTVAELMGHTSSRTTEHYVHLAGRREHLAAAMQQAVSRNRGS